MKPFSLFCFLTLGILLSSGLIAQQSAGGSPLSFSEYLTSFDELNLEQMAEFDENWVADREPNEVGKPFYFGYAYQVSIDILSKGTWDTTASRELVCRLRVKSDEAFSLNFIFDDFYLSPGSSLFVYNKTRDQVLGAFTSELNNREERVFSTDLIAGDEVVFEYNQSTLTKPESSLNISRVIHAYENVVTPLSSGLGTSGPCHNDVLCPIGDPWCVERRAVNMILLDENTAHCSACMLNNERENLIPYNLTAFHCADSDDDGEISTTEQNDMKTWLFRFQYWRPECGSSQPPSPFISFSGANMRASYLPTDMLLLELIDQPPIGSGVLYAGWDRTPNAPPPSGAGIHHPKGDAMKISLFGIPPVMAVHPPYIVYEVTWFTGVVEKGSSGSALFNNDRRVIGQLYGSTPGLISCSNPTALSLYGRLDVSWVGGGSPATGLRAWLDPGSTGVMTTDATSPEAFYVNRTLIGSNDFGNLEDVHIEGNVVVAGGSSLCPPNTTLFTAQSGSNSTFQGRTVKVYSGTQFQAGSNVRLIADNYECAIGYNPGDYVDLCGATVTTKRGQSTYGDLDYPNDELSDELWVYPNPSSGFLTVESVYELQRLEVWSINGQMIHQQDQSNSNKVEIDLGTAPEGVYLLRMYTPVGIKTEKVIKSAM